MRLDEGGAVQTPATATTGTGAFLNLCPHHMNIRLLRGIVRMINVTTEPLLIFSPGNILRLGNSIFIY